MLSAMKLTSWLVAICIFVGCTDQTTPPAKISVPIVKDVKSYAPEQIGNYHLETLTINYKSDYQNIDLDAADVREAIAIWLAANSTQKIISITPVVRKGINNNYISHIIIVSTDSEKN